jgi:AAA15 family ATPase/GTPase
MLVNFRVVNFLSLAQLNTLSLVKGQSRRHSQHVYQNPVINLLKFSAIYGANGAGKSNVIKAISFSKKIIAKNDLSPNLSHSYCRTNKKNKDLETSFEYEIFLDNKIYSYGFSILLFKGELKKEWLYEVTGGEEVSLFTMDFDTKEFNIDTSKLVDAPNLTNRLETYIDDFKSLKKYEESLFLHFVNDAKSEFPEDTVANIFNKLFVWFDRKLEIITPNKPADRSLVYLEDTDESIENFLKDFGTGITKIHKQNIDIEELYNVENPKFVNFVKDNFLEKVQSIKKDISSKEDGSDENKTAEFTGMMRTENNLYSIKIDTENNIQFRTIRFSHYADDDFYTLGEESDGTVRLLELYDIIKNNEGKVFVVDELDRSLHPNLTFNFIKNYLNSQNNSQLIVSTHEDRILDLSIMRRDEIWFVEKSDIGESRLYSLEEFKTRFDKDIMNAYLDGRYGSIPKFKFLNN